MTKSQLVSSFPLRTSGLFPTFCYLNDAALNVLAHTSGGPCGMDSLGHLSRVEGSISGQACPSVPGECLCLQGVQPLLLLSLQGSQGWACWPLPAGVCNTTMSFILHHRSTFPMSPCVKTLSSRRRKAAEAEAVQRGAGREMTAAEEGSGRGCLGRHCRRGASREGRDQGEG